MNQLTSILHTGNHTLVVRAVNGDILTFDGRGIADLMRLLDTEPQTLRGASIADKVVGKAAAALMIAGRISAVHADTISEQALMLFKAEAPGMAVGYDKAVPHIINRQQTGWCPMELACRDCLTAEESVIKIKEKLTELRKKHE